MNNALRNKTYIIQRKSFIITESRYPNSTVKCWMQYRWPLYFYVIQSDVQKIYGCSFRQDHEIISGLSQPFRSNKILINL